MERLVDLLRESESLGATAAVLRARLKCAQSRLKCAEHDLFDRAKYNDLLQLYPGAADDVNEDGKTPLALALSKNAADSVLLVFYFEDSQKLFGNLAGLNSNGIGITQQRYFQYDTSAHDLRGIVAAAIAPNLVPSDLHLLSDTKPLCKLKVQALLQRAVQGSA
eukprot:gene9-11310_t